MKIFRLCHKIIKSNVFHYKPTTIIPINRIENPSSASALKRLTHNYHGNPKLPDLLYFPHVFRWLNAKYRLKYLQKMWDSEFSEGAFIYGSTRAICRITEIIGDNKPQDLRDLVDAAVEKKLSHHMKAVLSDNQRRAMKLSSEDIKLLVPMKVYFETNNYKKKCHILLKTLAMKWLDIGNSLKLALIVLETEFTRDYSISNSEWTITIFNILQCSLVNNSRSP